MKQGLIQGRSETVIRDSEAGVRVTRAEAGVAYLAFAIRYARGWLFAHRPALFRGRKLVWFANLGMPAESYDDPTLAKPYRRIGAAALQLAKIDSPVTVDAARLFLDDPHVVKAGDSEEAAEALGVAVIPEAAAEMTGFAKSTRNAPGLYLLVDVGAMTLDVCMFRLNQDANAGDLYSFMAAQVRPLGVESFYWFLAKGKTKREFDKQCGQILLDVVNVTKKRRDPRASCWNSGREVPVFLAGGGAVNPLHRDQVLNLSKWMKQHWRNDGLRLLELPAPNAMDVPEPHQDFDFGRMTVAWGLSYPLTDIGKIEPMRDIEDVPPPPVVGYRNRFISKGQV